MQNFKASNLKSQTNSNYPITKYFEYLDFGNFSLFGIWILGI